MVRKLILLIESIFAALEANFTLSKAIADQVGLTGEGEIALNNAIGNFSNLKNDMDGFKRDVNDEPEAVEPPAEQPPA
jgi:hypothetical protein